MVNIDQRSIACGLIFISVIMGIMVCFWTWNFMKEQNQKERFLQIRKPLVILLYCICGSIPVLIITSPLEIYVEIFHKDNFRFNWLMMLIHEFLFASMLTVIAVRCWLLYYDHSYGMSIVDQNWRGVIDPNDTDFWLKNRKTWGDVGFLVCFGIVVISVGLMLFSTASIWVFETGNLDILPYVSLFVVAIPACIFISVLMFTGKLKKLYVLYDEFMIIKEMKFLCICTWFIVALFIVQILDFDQLFFEIAGTQILFSFITSYIQCNWVLRAMRSKQKDIVRYPSMSRAQREDRGTSVSPRSASPAVRNLSMGDVLRSKQGFGMFMRQCQNEVCVEGLLFIVEVAQFKSRIQEYKKNKKARKSGNDHSKSSKESTGRSRSRDGTESTSRSTQNSASSTTDPDAQVLPALGDIVVQQLRKDDGRFEQFRGNILSRNWLPISHQLEDPRNCNGHGHGQGAHNDIVHFKPNTLLEPINFGDEKNQISTPSPPPVQLQQEMDEKEICRLESLHSNSPSIPSPDMVKHEKEIKPTNEFLYNYARYLFLKYIDVDSDFAVNVSHHIHKQLLIFFSSVPTSRHYRKLDQVFDASVAETWNLLANDTFIRFKSTAQYRYILNHSSKFNIQ